MQVEQNQQELAKDNTPDIGKTKKEEVTQTLWRMGQQQTMAIWK